VLLIPLGIAVIVVGWLLLSGYARKVNLKAATAGGKRTFKEELLYCFHTMFHPFDGYWDLKHEKRGSVRASLVFVVLTILSFYYQNIGQGYITNARGVYSTFWAQVTGVLVPLLLFVVGNWCLTTLFEGEGSLKDIFIACAYSLAPLPVFIIGTTMFSNVALSNETDILELLVTFAFIWVFMLIFFGTMITHDYSMGKNIITFLGTIVGMALIMFVAVLFTTLVGKIVSLITNIVTELQYRA
jgi:hypothetical protein